MQNIHKENNPKKAIALISGGLDSMLAAKLLLEQNIHVEGINFFTGFCVEGHTHAIRKKDKNKAKRNNALWVAEQLGIKLHIIDIVEEYKDIVINPKHGYGANLNPCLDCKIFMLKKAHEWIKANNFDFIITGEVIGQRPKSQRKACMPIVAEKSGAEDLLLRPLSALNLELTKPELEGWVDREKLLGFTGRSRKPQFALAEKFNIEDYAQPAGGCCFLTDKAYSNKLQDLWTNRNSKHYELDDIMLLKVGRHIRPKDNFKIIVAREEGENNFLQGYKKNFISLELENTGGPIALIDGKIESDQDLELACKILGRFSKAESNDIVETKVTFKPEEGAIKSKIVQTHPFKAEEVLEAWYLK